MQFKVSMDNIARPFIKKHNSKTNGEREWGERKRRERTKVISRQKRINTDYKV